MEEQPIPDGWSRVGSGLAEYTRLLFDFTVLKRYVRVNYCYCLNAYHQKTFTPFSHNSDGTCPVRAYRLGYVLITVCDLRNRP